MYVVAAVLCGLIGGYIVNPTPEVRRRFPWLNVRNVLYLVVAGMLVLQTHTHAGLAWKLKWFALYDVMGNREENPISLLDDPSPRGAELKSLARLPNGSYRAILEANTILPADAKVLVFRQADYSFYGNHRIVNNFDPVMSEIYRQWDPDRVVEMLRELEIGYFFVPDYGEPTIYRTKLEDVLADPNRVELLTDRGAYRVLRLREAEEPPPRLEPRPLFNGEFARQSPSGTLVPGWTIAGSNSATSHWMRWQNELAETPKLTIWNKTLETVRLYTGRGLLNDPPRVVGRNTPLRSLPELESLLLAEATTLVDDTARRHDSLVEVLRSSEDFAGEGAMDALVAAPQQDVIVQAGETYHVTARVRGVGVVGLTALVFPPPGPGRPGAPVRHMMHESVLAPQMFYEIAGLFRVENDGTFRLSIEHRNEGWLEVESVQFVKVLPPLLDELESADPGDSPDRVAAGDDETERE